MLTIQQIERYMKGLLESPTRLYIVKKLSGHAEKNYAKVRCGFGYGIRRGLQYAQKKRRKYNTHYSQHYTGYYTESYCGARGLLYGFLILRAEKLGYYYRGAAGERHKEAYEQVGYIGGASAYGG